MNSKCNEKTIWLYKFTKLVHLFIITQWLVEAIKSTTFIKVLRILVYLYLYKLKLRSFSKYKLF